MRAVLRRSNGGLHDYRGFDRAAARLFQFYSAVTSLQCLMRKIGAPFCWCPTRTSSPILLTRSCLLRTHGSLRYISTDKANQPAKELRDCSYGRCCLSQPDRTSVV